MKKTVFLLMALCMLWGCARADVMVTGDHVNLRTGPGVGFRALANVRKGTVLGDLGYIGSDIDGESWYWVEHQGEECWIRDSFAQRGVTEPDASLAEGFSYKTLLGHWKMTAHTICGGQAEGGEPLDFVGAGLVLSLVHDGKEGVSLRGDVRFNDGENLRRFLLRAACAAQPVTAWQEKLADAAEGSGGWSARLYDPEAERDWDFYIDPMDENHLTMYWLLRADRGCIDAFAFERMGEQDTDDGAVPAAWLALGTEQLLGEWEAAYGRTDTYSYADASAEGIEAALSFERDEQGYVRIRWKPNGDTELCGNRIMLIDAMRIAEPIDAAWYVDLTAFMLRGRRALLYLENAETLCLNQLYTIDGMPASDCVVYKKRAE